MWCHSKTLGENRQGYHLSILVLSCQCYWYLLANLKLFQCLIHRPYRLRSSWPGADSWHLSLHYWLDSRVSPRSIMVTESWVIGVLIVGKYFEDLFALVCSWASSVRFTKLIGLLVGIDLEDLVERFG